MNLRPVSAVLHGASLLVLGVTAQSAWAQAGAAGASLSDSEIIVTARRREETAQDVPLVVNAVSGDTLGKLNIRDFRDVQNVVPGLQLTPAPGGTQSNASLRGVFNDITAAGNNPSVQFYMNDAPIALSTLLTSMFDVGQVEVLRGPQGTLRGRAAPSGSISVTTRDANLHELGGYVNMTGQTHGAINVNAALGVPIIKDVLAVRIAGLRDETNSTRVYSITNGAHPWSRTTGERISLRFDPIDSLSIKGSFTNVVRVARDFQQVESGNIVDPAVPVSPTFITGSDRLSVAAAYQPLRTQFRVWNWSADWRIAGQRLVYVGSHTISETSTFAPNDSVNAFSRLNDIVRFSGQSSDNHTVDDSHELRLQSDAQLFGMFDYIIGGFIYKSTPQTHINQQTPVYLSNPTTNAPPFRFVQTPVDRNSNSIERSAFFNLTAHFGDRTELSGGVRYIDYSADNYTIQATSSRNDPVKDHQWIYTASFKHNFNDDLMAYASVGSSWRPGSTTNAVIDTNIAPSPRELALQKPQPSETSTSYEIGIKSELFDKRLRLNVSAFHQDFKNYIFFAPNIYVANTTPTGSGPRSLTGLATGVPAKVDGVEGDVAVKIASNFDLSASFAYARSRIKNGSIPCNNFPTPPANNAVITGANGGETVGACTVNYSASRSSPFSTTVQSEYRRPLASDVDSFVRGLVTFNGDTRADPSNPYDDLKAYALTNVYAGIRSPDGTWEVSLFGKNIFDVTRVLTRNANVQTPTIQIGSTATPQASTYRYITTTAPREFGINLRYAFGSR